MQYNTGRCHASDRPKAFTRNCFWVYHNRRCLVYHGRCLVDQARFSTPSPPHPKLTTAQLQLPQNVPLVFIEVGDRFFCILYTSDNPWSSNYSSPQRPPRSAVKRKTVRDRRSHYCCAKAMSLW